MVYKNNLSFRAIATTAALALAAPGLSAASAQAPGPRIGAQPPRTAHELAVAGDDAGAIARLGVRLSDKPVREMIPNWRKPRKGIVFLAEGQSLDYFQSAAPDVKLVAVDEKNAVAEVADADFQVGGVCNRAVIAAGKQLRWIHANESGVESCFAGAETAPLKSGQIVLTNKQRVSGQSIANHVIAMMYTLSRGLDLYAREAGSETYATMPAGRLRLVPGQTMLVVGLGGTGSEVARLSHLLDMRVIATRATRRETPPYVDYVGLPDELPALIGQADVVVDALPLTNDTANTFNAAMFGRMKKGAFFINVGRGGTVATDDLVAALKSGQVGGAGLDVTAPEPLPKGHPLWHAPNVILTPHHAGYWTGQDGEELYGARSRASWSVERENLRRYLAGDKLYSVVNPAAGY